ncbi:MAG TPA: DNA gyrase inhibitor YacG [Burkholderiales bacterium]|nr:DNA gyrase inhibitor YacG [Burkholderiales bacterium]
MQPVKTVPCPRCGAAAAFSHDNKWRPFCSERCRLIDLGKWASEDYRVPTKEEAARQPPEDPTEESR